MKPVVSSMMWGAVLSESSESQWDEPVSGGEEAGGRVSDVCEGQVELLPLQLPLEDWWSSLWSI